MSGELPKPSLSVEHLRLLYQVSNVIHSTLDSQAAFQLIVNEAVRVMRATSGSLALINPTSSLLEIHAAKNLSAAAQTLKLQIGAGITGWVAQYGEPARIGDVSTDNRYVNVRREVRSELAVPLEVDGEVRGVINVDSERINAFSAEDQELLQELALQASKVIKNTWLCDQLRLKVKLFESLDSVSRAINSTLNLDEALRVITREACELMQARRCSLMLLDESRAWLDLRASFGVGTAYQKRTRLSCEESFIGVVVRRKKPMQIANVQLDTRYQNFDLARREKLVSLLSVPLVFAHQAIGAISVYTAKPHVFSNEEIRILSALAELSAIAIEKARLYERVVDVEEQLRQNEKFSVLGLLAAEVAHEIRNPLTVMKLLYHSLNLKFDAKDPRSTDATIIESKIEQLNKTVDHILDFAKTTEPTFAPVHLNRLVDELFLLVRHKFANQNIRLVRDLSEDLPPVMGDAPQLEQAFLNLILNAAEAMPSGGTLTIKSQACKPESGKPNRVVLEFKDTGVGMSVAQTRQAFKSTLVTTKAKGAGLGLAIVGRIIEAHHGEIKIKSRKNFGTSISVLFSAK